MCCPIFLSPSTFDIQKASSAFTSAPAFFCLYVSQQARGKIMGIAAIREQERLEKERKKKRKEEDDFVRKRQDANYQAWKARKDAEKKGETWPPPTSTPTSTPADRQEGDTLCGAIVLVILLAVFGYFLYGYGFHDSCDTWGEFLGICGLLWLLYPVALILACSICCVCRDACG